MRILVLGFLFCLPLYAVDIIVETPYGDSLLMEVEPEASLLQLQEEIERDFDFPINSQEVVIKTCERMECDEFMLEFAARRNKNISRKTTPTPRNYNVAVTTQEKQDIAYIVKTLGSKPLAALLGYKFSLESAGDRVNHVHPLRFLMCIFTDEELKVGIRNIHNRGGWVWSDFINGLNGSLSEEYKRNNLTDAQLNNFAKTVGIDTKLINPYVKDSRWTDFVVTLIKKVPRKGDTGRYDM